MKAVCSRDRAGDHREQVEPWRVVGHLAEVFDGARVVRQLAVPLDVVDQDQVMGQVRSAAERQERRPCEPEQRRQRRAANEQEGECLVETPTKVAAKPHERHERRDNRRPCADPRPNAEPKAIEEIRRRERSGECDHGHHRQKLGERQALLVCRSRAGRGSRGRVHARRQPIVFFASSRGAGAHTGATASRDRAASTRCTCLPGGWPTTSASR